MLLNAQQILAANDRKTRTVPVPEWGEGAEVLVGSMGALARARMQDWTETLGQVPDEPEESKDETLSCDSPPPDSEAEKPADAGKVYSMTENVKVMVRWCAASILDPETLKPALTEEQVDTLGSKSTVALRRIYDAALALNLETPESSESFEKNSGGTPGDSSGSD